MENKKGSWKKLEGKFLERQTAPSDMQCRCGCGEYVSGRAKRKFEKTGEGGYIHGHYFKGRKMTDEQKKNMFGPRPSICGENNPNYGKGLLGEANPNWQGGKTKKYLPGGHPESGRKNDREYRKEIKERDVSCVLCGAKSRLHMHHIISWIDSEALRFTPWNCVTLCISCHTRADNLHHKERVRPMLLSYLETLYGEDKINEIKAQIT